MSITFSPEHVGTGRFNIIRHDDHGETVVFATFPSYAEAELNFLTACAAEGVDTWEAFMVAESAIESAPSINMANDNAADVLRTLDLDTEFMCGSEDGLAFMERVMMAVQDEWKNAEARPTVDTGGPGTGQARMIDVGRSASYVGDKLNDLIDVAIFAKDHGLAVTWG